MASLDDLIENPLVKAYREMLRVDRMATPPQLEGAFIALASLFHSGRNSSREAQKMFIRGKEALETLTDQQVVRALNQEYFRFRQSQVFFEGLSLSYGSLFGHRFFSANQIGGEPWGRLTGSDKPFTTTLEIVSGAARLPEPDEEDFSILDHPDWDSVEVVLAGKHSQADEDALAEAYAAGSSAPLPWFLLNAQGVVEFLEGHFRKALDRYVELNQRVPGNIVFLFRMAVCHAVLAFHQKKRDVAGKIVPDPFHVKQAIQQLEHAVEIGRKRAPEPQDCVSIRKILADLLEETGQTTRAHTIWKEIERIRPMSREAPQRAGKTSSWLSRLLNRVWSYR